MIEKPSTNSFSYRWIQTNAELESFAKRASTQSELYLDTEFVRRVTYWPIPALIQFRSEGKNYLLDVPAIDDWSPLSALLASKTITKVLHGASEDLIVLIRLTATKPNNIFDTQVAHAFKSEQRSIGYSALIKEMLQIDIAQSTKLQQSDWLRRPLSEAQCQYAVEDVEYIERIYEQQQGFLSNHQHLQQWNKEVCDEMISIAMEMCHIQPEQAYLAVKGVDKVRSAMVLTRLQALASWREQQALDMDVPRGFILTDKTLLYLAKRSADDQIAWEELPKGRKFRTKYTAVIADLLAQTTKPTVSVKPFARLPSMLTPVYEQMVAEKKRIANQYGICDQLLANKRELHKFIVSNGAHAFEGWRNELLQAPLQALLPRRS